VYVQIPTRVGILNNSALVIIGHQPAKQVHVKNPWDEYYSPSIRHVDGQKSKIEHAERMWKWKFLKLARFGPSSVPDVTFTYLAALNVSQKVLASCVSRRQVRLGSTALGRRKGYLVDGKRRGGRSIDVYGGADTVSFDCVYGILNLNGVHFRRSRFAARKFGILKKGERKFQMTQ